MSKVLFYLSQFSDFHVTMMPSHVNDFFNTIMFNTPEGLYQNPE